MVLSLFTGDPKDYLGTTSNLFYPGPQMCCDL